MKASELRIGNIVLWDSIVYPPNFMLARPTRLDWFPDKKLFDIPECVPFAGVYLTEEWLEKFGFKKDYDKCETLIIDKNRFQWSKGVLTWQQNPHNDWSSFDCKYIHELQNLYYALTKEELVLAVNPL